MKKQNAKTTTGTFRHYRRQADGSLAFVGVVTYARPAEQDATDPLVDRRDALAERDAAYRAWCKRYCAAFEDLADQACGAEG